MKSFSTLPEALVAVRDEPRSITFIEGQGAEQTLTYAELHDRALSRLGQLQTHGLSAGDQLILFLKDNAQFVEALWAGFLGGIVPVPIAVGISDEHRAKLFNVFELLERPWLYTDRTNFERLEAFAATHDRQDTLARLRERTLLVDELDPPQAPGRAHAGQSDDVAFIQFSSGSTSQPKGVVLTHRNLMSNLRGIGEGAGYHRDDTSLSWMPLTHDMGLIGFHLNMIAYGMNQCLMPTDLFSRRPLLWLQKASEKRATVLCSPNFGYKHFLKVMGSKGLEDVDLSHVRLIYNGAEPISVDLCDEFLTALAPYGLRRETMFTVYGLAEATLAVAFPPLGEPYRAVHVDRHALSLGETVRTVSTDDPNCVSFAIVGRPVRDCQVRIAGEAHDPLPGATVGRVEIRGDNVTAGYYRNPEANAEALTGDGWLDTGDLGFIHEGELIITGRSKEIIFANGLNYYPHDIEDIALELDELELGKVVAVGQHRDEAQREELLIFLLYRGDLAEFPALAGRVARHINEQTGLEVTHVIPVKRIPKTTSGKLQRTALGRDYINGEFDAVLAELAALSPAAPADSGEAATPLAAELKAIFDTVIPDKHVGYDDDFFDIGISSLVLAQIHEKINETWPGETDVVDLFEFTTINLLAENMEKQRQEAANA